MIAPVQSTTSIHSSVIHLIFPDWVAHLFSSQWIYAYLQHVIPCPRFTHLESKRSDTLWLGSPSIVWSNSFALSIACQIMMIDTIVANHTAEVIVLGDFNINIDWSGASKKTHLQKCFTSRWQRNVSLNEAVPPHTPVKDWWNSIACFQSMVCN